MKRLGSFCLLFRLFFEEKEHKSSYYKEKVKIFEVAFFSFADLLYFCNEKCIIPSKANVSMEERIEHQGIVESVEDDCVKVKIVQVAACAECKAKSLCSSAESKEKVIEVKGRGVGTGVRVGESVLVYGSMQMGWAALRVAFIFPMVLLLIVGAICIAMLKVSEERTLLLMLLSLLLYGIVVYALRSRIERRFSFGIEKL